MRPDNNRVDNDGHEIAGLDNGRCKLYCWLHCWTSYVEKLIIHLANCCCQFVNRNKDSSNSAFSQITSDLLLMHRLCSCTVLRLRKRVAVRVAVYCVVLMYRLFFVGRSVLR